jgi:hypothetical protein
MNFESHRLLCQSESRQQNIRQDVLLLPSAFDGQDDDVCDKVGQVVGNLQSLERLLIYCHYYRTDGDHGDDQVAQRAARCEIWSTSSRL